jgi:hypothetical protein
MSGSTQNWRKPSTLPVNTQRPKFGSDKTSKPISDIFSPSVQNNTVQAEVPHQQPPPEQKNRELLQAIKSNHPEEVRQHLEEGADANARDRLFYTALHRAVDQGNPETIDLLLKAGADPNAKAPLFQAPPMHKDPNSQQAQQINQLGGDTGTLSPVVQDTPIDRALHHHKPAVIPAIILGGAECSKEQLPKVHDALKTIYQTQDLTTRLEQAITELDGKTTKVLLQVGIESKKLPYLYGDLLENAIDSAKANGPEDEDSHKNRLRQHHGSLQMLRLLAPFVRDYSYLAHIIAQNQETVLPAQNS